MPLPPAQPQIQHPPSPKLQLPSALLAHRAQQLSAIRSAATAPADAMDIWGISSAKVAGAAKAGQLQPIGSLDHIVKQPSDSLLTVHLPFGSDASLRRQYVNFRGQLRVGKLLEELDAFAGNCAYAHCDDGDPSTELPTLVTVSLDRLDLLRYPLKPEEDLKMRGCVTYVGSSSMNVDVDFTTVATNEAVMMASTTFVARNPRGGGPVSVPRLRAMEDWESRLMEAGRASAESRRAARSSALDRVPPTPAELATVHQLFMELNAGASDASPPVYMSDTRVTSSELTMPQDRNLHGKIFGGWMMRRAYETAWIAGWSATGALPRFLALDDVAFNRPVEVRTRGSVLHAVLRARQGVARL